MGREYATNHLIVYLAILSTRYGASSAMVCCMMLRAKGRLEQASQSKRELAEAASLYYEWNAVSVIGTMQATAPERESSALQL